MSNSPAPATDPDSVPHSPRRTPMFADRPWYSRATPRHRNAVATIEDVCFPLVDPLAGTRARTTRAMFAGPRDRRISPPEATVAR